MFMFSIHSDRADLYNTLIWENEKLTLGSQRAASDDRMKSFFKSIQAQFLFFAFFAQSTDSLKFQKNRDRRAVAFPH